MKTFVKFAAAAALVLVSSNTMAQYAPEAGDVSTEVQFNPFGDAFNTFKLENNIVFKVRTFLTDRDALRLKVGLRFDNNSDVTKTFFTDNFDTNKPAYTLNNQEVETNNKATYFDFSLGYERHFITDGRLDVYVGAEFGYESAAYSGDVTTTINNDQMTGTTGNTTRTETVSTYKQVYEKQSTDGSKINSHGFFIGAFTGVDFYIYKGLYVGTELGIQFNSYTSQAIPNYTADFDETRITTNTIGSTSTVNTRNTTYSESTETGKRVGKIVNVAGSTTTETKIEQAAAMTDVERKYSGLFTYITPALRLGWKF